MRAALPKGRARLSRAYEPLARRSAPVELPAGGPRLALGRGNAMVQREEKRRTSAEGSASGHLPREHLYLASVMVLTVAVFYPLLGYFFAQDDFQLISKARYLTGGFLKTFFDPVAGQFRPLTKGLYFLVMERIFDTKPLPFHLVSLLFHLVNVVLFHRILRKFSIRPAAALVATALFAFDLCFVNVVGWVSCIQQLAGEGFFLGCLLVGMDALRRGGGKRMLLASLLYFLALASLEQTYAAPAVLLVYAYLEGRGSRRERLLRGVQSLLPLLAMMGSYVIFMLVWKRLPGGGIYQMHLGSNIIRNLVTYAHWSLDFFMRMPFLLDTTNTGFSGSHLLLIALVGYHLLEGRTKLVALALAAFLLPVLPVSLLVAHTYPNHLYVPSLGIFLLVGGILGDAEELVLRRGADRARILAASLVLIFMASSVQLRLSERDKVSSNYPLPLNFVLRRALIAENAFTDLEKKAPPLPRGGKFFAVLLHRFPWYRQNVAAALGQGAALKLLYDDPQLQVYFASMGDTLSAYDPRDSAVLFFDEQGHFYTREEAKTKGTSVKQLDR